MFYRSRWAHVYEDAAAIDIPELVESLYVWIARAYAAGYERGDVASIHQRMAEIEASPLFQVAKRSDGMAQPWITRPLYGGAEIHRKRSGHGQAWVVNRIPGPI
jgi:hypothetical protein